MTNGQNIRELALNTLIDITENNNYSHLAINNTLKVYQYLEKKDRAFISRLCEGTVEQLIRIDYIINQFSSIKVKKMKPVIRNLLRISVYQIMFMNHIPDSAACNEAVKLAQKKGFKNLKGFVNGVLRNISRNKEDIDYPNEYTEPVRYLSVLYSIPEWILLKWLEEFEYNTVKLMLESSMEEKKTTIRCNLLKNSKEELKEKLKKENIVVEDGNYLQYALKISGYDYINNIKAFKEGCFQVQDESSMLIAEAAGIKEGFNVLDICAAPGGKALHIAEKLGESGLVTARDLSEYKVSLIEDNRERLGIENLKAEVFDALVPDKDKFEKMDIVIADLPCSGLGVIGKKNDIKYKITEDKQKELVNLQRKMLGVAQEYVKPGGLLIYSTCTVNIEENLKNSIWFSENFDFNFESIEEKLPKTIVSDTKKDGYIQLIPGIHSTDGFFIATFRKHSKG